MRRPPAGVRRAVARAAGALAVALAVAPRAGAQVAPDGEWRTLRTPHLRVHFRPPLEEMARRTAASAELAWAQLARELTPPRAPVDVVVADNVDYANGYATVFPTNRVVVYAQPPVEGQTLRYYADWNALVVTHELVHLFHLDRARGVWGVAQRVVGRHPLLFPNRYSPAWLTEGLAVYYESRLTGFGRLAGTPHRALARAAAAGGHLPRLDELSLATPAWPRGLAAYAYGSLVVDHLARTRGAAEVGDFVERASALTVPFFLNRAARGSFGISLERAWREWRDSAGRAAGPAAPPLPGWRELTREGWEVAYPRWTDSLRLLYVAAPGREVPGVYEVGGVGQARRVGRRNGVEPTTRRGDGALVYTQLDYTDPYTVRGDLWVQQGRRERRLTRGARLSHADVRADGLVVAVQAAPGATRLVLVSADGREMRPLTGTSPDTLWAEPRWSPAGDRVAAVRWTRGGTASVVVLDSTGRSARELAPSRSVEQAPAWSADGRAVYFTSDRSGVAEVWAVSAEGGAARPVSRAVAGLFYPSPAPGGASLAAVELRASGFHLGVAPVPERASASAGDSTAASAPRAAPRAATHGAASADAAPPSLAAGAATRYAAWRTLRPRWWTPITGTTDREAFQLGAYTSGEDVLGRHEYAVQFLTGLRGRGEPDVSASYRWSGLGQPVLSAGVDQFWEHYLGAGYTRRTRVAAVAATVTRPRVRSSSSLSLGTEVELRSYDHSPDSLLARLAPDLRSAHAFQSVTLSGGWANVQRPPLAVSPEDGVSLSATLRERWRSGRPEEAGATVVGVARGYRAFDLPGYAHHVLAVRAAGGWSGRRATTEFTAGGVSGSSLELLPGYTLGDPQRTFGLRGHAPGVRRGTHALGGTVEYRAPLTIPARGYRLFPLFLSRTALAAFAEGAAAWCPRGASAPLLCAGRASDRSTIASAGVELHVEAAPQFDTPYRFRLGLASPLGTSSPGRGPVAGYLTLGLSF